MKLSKAAKSMLKRFVGDKKGSIMTTTALTIFPVMLTIGLAVDYSRMYKMQERVLAASDTALLAASSVYGKERANYNDPEDIIALLEEEFEPMFRENMEQAGYGDDVNYTISFDIEDSKARVTIAGSVPTSFMKIAGKNDFNFRTGTEINLAFTPENYVLDIAMCIDATGSMQNTINSVRANAKTFSDQLMTELGIPEDYEYLKIRVRPIYYRDQIDQYLWEMANAGQYVWGNQFGQPGKDDASARAKLQNTHRYKKMPSHFSNYDYYWQHSYWKTRMRPGIVAADDFFELNGENADAQGQAFRNFLDSENAFAGWDWPESGQACTHEAMQSKWYDKSDPANDDDFPDPVDVAAEKRVTVFPIVVAWTDADIHSDMRRNREWLSTQDTMKWNRKYSMPTNWNTLKTRWNKIDLNPDFKGKFDDLGDPLVSPKMYVLFTSASNLNAYGWREIKNWNGFEYGGSLQTGNDDAIKVIAEKIKKNLKLKFHISS